MSREAGSEVLWGHAGGEPGPAARWVTGEGLGWDRRMAQWYQEERPPKALRVDRTSLELSSSGRRRRPGQKPGRGAPRGRHGPKRRRSL